MDEPIPLARPVIGEAEEQAVLEVLRSGQLSLGPKLEEFERRFAECVDAPLASAVSSGTAGLELSLRAVGVGPGDEVVTSPLSFVASANVCVIEGATPVFADIDPVTLTLDPQAAAAAVTERTTAVLPVHIFGYPAAMAELEALDLPMVEDACEALGARYADGTKVGSRENPAVFGFYANKQMTTGEGGMITLGSAEMKELIDSERNQGRSPDMGWLAHERLGFNFRLSDIACALGIAQLSHLDEMLAARERVAGWYGDRLSGIDGLQIPCPDRGQERRGWFVYVVQIPAGTDRDETIRRLADRGVQSKPYLPAIHLMPLYRERFGYREGQFPVCEEVAERSIALPFFPQMTEEQVERVAAELLPAIGRA